MSGSDTGIEVPALSRVKIRLAAERARSVLRVGPGRIDAERLVERLFEFGITVDVFDLQSAPVPTDVEACWVPESSTLYIRDRIYDQMVMGGARAMFTLGHELGHVVLAHRRTLNRAISAAPLPAYRNSEWQADTFSAEFVMPLDSINAQGLFTSGALARYFGVSDAAAQVRLSILAQYGELTKKPQSVGALRGF